MYVRLLGRLFVSLLLFAASVACADDESPKTLIQQALRLKLQADPVWLALLHVDHGKTHIEDSHFLASLPQFSPQKELVLTIQQLFDEHIGTNTRCRFPARDAWLRSKLSLPIASYDHCADFKEFINKAPATTISLVYASENIAQASSMMGHILLKLSGQNDQGQQVEHAVTFYTEVKGINVPKIMYDSLIVGKKGYFALSPFSEKRDYYAHNEQRNVWIYDLALTEDSRRLIHWHLWELHQTQLRYFFHSYNCATFTQFILAVTGHPTLHQTTGWSTPLDVVKRVNRAGLVAKTRMYPSSRSRVRILSNQRSLLWKHHIAQAVQQQNLTLLPAAKDESEQFITLKTSQAYADYLHETGELTAPSSQAFSQQLSEKINNLSQHYQIDLSDYKSPLLAPNDSQWYGGWVHFNNEDYLRLGILPAAHRLDDDNRQSMSENELRLGDIALLINPKKQTMQLEHFQLYAMASYVPLDLLTGGISGRFNIGYGTIYGANLTRLKATQISGAVGINIQAQPDIHIYSLVNLGVAYGNNRLYQYATPEVGMIINEVYGMKSIISLDSTRYSNSSNDHLQTLQWTQAIPLSAEHRLMLRYVDRWQQAKHEQQVELIVKWLW